MFLTLASLFPTPESVFRVHPVQLSRWLDEVWTLARSGHILGPNGVADRDGRLVADFRGILPDDVLDALDLPTQPLGLFLAPSGINVGGDPEWSGQPGPVEFDCPSRLWHHLIYSYLLESTGMLEIFAEIVRRLVVGETVGALQQANSISWLRTTEQLFFREPPDFSIVGVLSEVRPYERTNRRNAYWRMFGMDLAHPVPPQWDRVGPLADWKAHTGAVNGDFRQKWSELLRQVWLGIENRRNESGPNPTDASYIALLCRAMRDSLTNRRRGGALAREELAYVSMFSWFHLTVDTDTPIVRDLQAQASNAAERLAALAQKVGMTPAARSRELFDLAEPMSTVLRSIELGLFDTADTAAALFEENSPVATDMGNIINNWQSATGERVKERPTGTVVAGSAQPLRVPAPGMPAAPQPASAAAGTTPTNGQRT
jgi:hypothetical protein